MTCSRCVDFTAERNALWPGLEGGASQEANLLLAEETFPGGGHRASPSAPTPDPGLQVRGWPLPTERFGQVPRYLEPQSPHLYGGATSQSGNNEVGYS